MTGQLSFDANGKRNKYKIDVYRVELNTKLTKVEIGKFSKDLLIKETQLGCSCKFTFSLLLKILRLLCFTNFL